jgi:glycosyltransferase involved in cell wall biosynthesis
VGGTKPSLVEAMNLGLFIITFKVEYNIETTENSAIYFQNKEDLKHILNQYQNNSFDIKAYQIKMKEIAGKRYRWDIITRKYANVFNCLK